MPTAHPTDPNVGPDDWPEPTSPATTTTGDALALALPRRSPIDWERTRLTPGLVRALAKAQAEAATVGKESTIQGSGSGDREIKARKYANADAMIEEATRVFAANGIAWVCASTSRQPDEPRFEAESTDKQWCCSVIETTSVLLHASDDDAVGVLVTYGETASIGRSSTPIDKADKAAETYLRLYLARDLAGLDRGEAADSVDQRDDTDAAARSNTRGRGSQGPQDAALRLTAARREAFARWKALALLIKQRDGVEPDASAWIYNALGHDPRSVEDYEQLTSIVSEEITAIKSAAASSTGGA